MAKKLPGSNVRTQDGGLNIVPLGTGAFALVGTGTKELKSVQKIVSAKDAEKFGDGSLRRAVRRILNLGGAELIGYAVADAADTADYLAGVDALVAEPTAKECIAIVDATDKAVWAGVAQKMNDAADNGHKYMYSVLQAILQKDAESDTAYATALVSAGVRGNVLSKRLAICAGSVPITAGDGSISDAPLIDTVLGLLAGRAAHEGIDAVKYGKIPNVESLSQNFSDAELTSLLNAGYVTARHFYGRAGTYITLAVLATEDTSDYDVLSKIRVVNRASQFVRDAQLDFVNDDIPADAGGAALIQKTSEVPLEQMKAAGEIAGFKITVDVSKLINERKVETAVAIVPLGKTSVLETTITYTREA